MPIVFVMQGKCLFSDILRPVQIYTVLENRSQLIRIHTVFHSACLHANNFNPASKLDKNWGRVK